MNKKPKVIPKARFTPIPPLLLKEETATAISVRMKAEMGMLQRLWRTSKWLLIKTDPRSFSSLINSLSSANVSVSAI